MTNQSSLSKGMNCLRCLVLFLTVAAMMTAPCHAESDLPQEEESPAMIDPSHPDYITEIQPLAVESAPPPVQPLEVAAAVETPAPVEAPIQVPLETPVPVEPQAEIPVEPQAEAPVEVPSESPATVESPAPEAAPAAGDALPEDVPQTQEMPQ